MSDLRGERPTNPGQALQFILLYAEQTFEYWGQDDDVKVGKRVLAMAGRLPGYSPDLDESYRLLKFDSRFLNTTTHGARHDDDRPTAQRIPGNT